VWDNVFVVSKDNIQNGEIKMKMFYTKGKKTVEYQIVTDDPQAMYRDTFKLKPRHIVCEDESLRDEILADIISSDNPKAKMTGKWWG
jgi:hypothetical protein